MLTEPADLAPYLTDHRRLYQGAALAVARPGSVEEVARVLALCNTHRVGVVPHGGNTGYCGGATPDESGRQLVLALSRLNRIRSVDADNDSLIAEAGCTLARVQAAAAAAERFFPLSLGSEGTCQLGGNLSTNAGGTNVLRYGMARNLTLGLEVVLADGRILEGLSVLRKDNTGYDVKSLFLGAEGTLGVITAASVKLFPMIRSRASAFIAVAGVRAASALLTRMRSASSDRVSSFELIPRSALELVLRHIPGSTDPLDRAYPWYVLCELTGSGEADGLDALLEQSLAAALTDGAILDAALARSGPQQDAFWGIRDSIPEAQRREGAGIKHDIALPVGKLADFMDLAVAWVATHVPEGRLVAYGHAGDGNLHFNISAVTPAAGAALLARTEAVRRAIHDLVRQFGGSFSAEHGIGRLKVGELERYTSPVELSLMQAMKRVLDPNHIMNPGKVLRQP
ncbi:MAG: FAD-binding oxidoreductase [Proteobacteria bacterium]|nr:FAD-binding oxidoreductase [Pseudomonadota bacterium]